MSTRKQYTKNGWPKSPHRHFLSYIDCPEKVVNDLMYHLDYHYDVRTEKAVAKIGSQYSGWKLCTVSMRLKKRDYNEIVAYIAGFMARESCASHTPTGDHYHMRREQNAAVGGGKHTQKATVIRRRPKRVECVNCGWPVQGVRYYLGLVTDCLANLQRLADELDKRFDVSVDRSRLAEATDQHPIEWSVHTVPTVLSEIQEAEVVAYVAGYVFGQQQQKVRQWPHTTNEA